jgi:hypothetical protein
MSIPETRVARTVPQVHDHIQLGVERNSGKCDHRQEVALRDRTGKLCEIEGVTVQCAAVLYIYLHSVSPQYLPQHAILYSTCTCTLLVPNISLNMLFSNTLSLCSVNIKGKL